MPAIKLTQHVVEKPWGRHDLWPGFEAHEGGSAPIGEIWFTAEDGRDPDLLVKYLFTSEKLSIQVHPDDVQAQARGYARGKDEAWLVLAAEPDSTIALGPKRPMTDDELRRAALDGSIVDLMHWQTVKAGDFIYSPAGTVHAIGAGLTIIEIQQNLDLTYRLYDYGRPRELHLDDGAAVSLLMPFEPLPAPQDADLYADGPKFVVERLRPGTHAIAGGDAPAVLVPVTGGGSVDGAHCTAGECWRLEGDVSLTVDPCGEMLLSYPGAQRR